MQQKHLLLFLRVLVLSNRHKPFREIRRTLRHEVYFMSTKRFWFINLLVWWTCLFIQQYVHINITHCIQNRTALLQCISPGESLSAHDCLAAVYCVLTFVLMTHLGRQGWCNKEVPGAPPGWESGNYSASLQSFFFFFFQHWSFRFQSLEVCRHRSEEEIRAFGASDTVLKMSFSSSSQVRCIRNLEMESWVWI